MPNTKEELFSDGTTQGDFDTIVISLGGTWDPGLPIAAARAGALGLLDLTLPTDAERVVRAILRLQALARGRRGLLLKGQPGPLESVALEAFGSAAADPRPQRSVIVLTADDPPSLSEVVARCRPLASRLGMLVLSEAEAELAAEHGLDFVLAKGNEAGGRVSPETTFVLLQRLLTWGRLPTYAWGGIGFSTAAACWVAGAAGIVLDWQLALLRESPLPEGARSVIAAMDGSETQAVEAPGGAEFRSLRRPPAEPSSETANWPVGQDAAFASLWREEAATVAQVLGVIGERIARFAALTEDAVPLRPGSPLAVSHGTRYPLVQGPMAHVSDTAAFARAVASGGALPFLALARMSGRDATELLETTREALGTMPWGVGLLGFAPRELWNEQLEALRAVRPSFALIAGGRPDQAEALESWGIRCYLHAPSPETLSQFLRQGVRRFVIEGRESGGHVGPRSSFTLWETSIHALLSSGLAARELTEVHVLFAGGIGDGLGGSMVSALAQPLVRRGVKVGALMGTAYLLTREIVATGAVVAEFQAAALACRTTRVLEAAPGHALRCADSPYCQVFERERLRLVEAGVPLEERKEALERVHLGRLAVAAKGIAQRREADGGVWRPVSVPVQREEGLYLMGQGAARATASLSIPALHEEVCVGALRGCGNVDGRPRLPARDRGRPPAPHPLEIAIVGMSCLLPGARSLEEYWRNIVAGRDLVTEIPPDRFPVDRWFDPDPAAPDKTYSRWGGFLPEIEFDPVRYGIPPASLPSIDPVQLLSLQLVDDALADAGYRDRNPDRARTSVIFGAGGGLGEVGCGYVARALLPGLVGEAGPGILDRLPEWTEDSFPGLLPNVIAGRISNRFDLGGPNYTIDAACASSLAALQAACRELSDGSSDLAIAGAADTVQNPFSYLAFSKTKALSPRGRCRPFDRGADGIVISEGLAAVVLKRLSDAERDGDRIYAVLRAVAGGSDGKSLALTAPRADGQLRTLERAYEQAGFSPAEVELVEAHGTGTAVGDAAECEALHRLLERRGALPRSVAVGSVKSMIGHTKAAAGMAGLLKTALSLFHRVLPPTLHVEVPDPGCFPPSSALYVNAEVRPWLRGASPRRAAVSSFGFGGTNFHAVLEEYRDAPSEDAARRLPRESRPEIVFFQGISSAEVAAQVRRVRRRLSEAGDRTTPAGLAAQLVARPAEPGSVRAAAVFDSVEELMGQLEALAGALADDTVNPRPLPRGVHLKSPPAATRPRLAFLFPGQGSQFPNMLRELALEFSEVSEAFEAADERSREGFDRPLRYFLFPPPAFSEAERRGAAEDLANTRVAQPALGAASLGVLRLLAAHGVHPDMTAGLSYGELPALHAAGCFDAGTLHSLSAARGRAFAAAGEGRDLGTMVAVAASAETADAAIRDLPGVWVANVNGPEQTVLSGTARSVEAAIERLRERNLDATLIPVGAAFHTPLMEPARERFAEALTAANIAPPRIPVYSNATAAPYPESAAGVRELLSRHITDRVRFAEQVRAMARDGARVFLEVGPGRVLTRLVGTILADTPHAAIAVCPGPSVEGEALLNALGACFVEGIDVKVSRRFEEGKPDQQAAAAPSSPIWLINGGYARPLGEPPRRFPAEDAGAPPIAPVHGRSEAPEAAGMLAEFQETMRQFLATQERVLEAYLGGSPAAAEEVAPPLKVGPSPEVSPRVEPTHDASPSGKSLRELVVYTVSARTGYPSEMLDGCADLEGDLGIDSIKRTEIVGALSRAVSGGSSCCAADLVDELIACRTIDGLIGVLSRPDERPARRPGIPRGAPPPREEEHRGPPEHTAARPQECPRFVEVSVESPLWGSLERLPRDGVVLLTDDGAGVAPAAAAALASRGRRTALLTLDDLSSPGSARDAVGRALDGSPGLDGFVHLLPLRAAPDFPGLTHAEWSRYADPEVKGLLYVLQALAPKLRAAEGGPPCVLALSRGGGGFARGAPADAAHPWRAGLAALLKTAQNEWSAARFRAVDVDRAPDVDLILQELATPGPVEIGYRDGKRLTREVVRAELPLEPVAPLRLGPEQVLVALGGARGITARVALRVARGTGVKLVLVGRSPAPPDEEDPYAGVARSRQDLRQALLREQRRSGEAATPAAVEKRLRSLLAEREMRASLAAMRGASTRVEYVRCDASDREAFARCLRRILEKYGGIDAVLHGAGIIEDHTLREKTSESFDRVVGTKVGPLLTLTELLDPARLGALVLFCSVVGIIGSPGQGDYAAGNEMLNAMGRRLRHLWPGRLLSLRWGPWREPGMVTPELADRFEASGIELIEAASGCEALWRELVSAEPDHVGVVAGRRALGGRPRPSPAEAQRSWGGGMKAPGEVARPWPKGAGEWPVELVVVSAAARGDLARKVVDLAARSEAAEGILLRDIAAVCARETGAQRVAVVAESRDALARKLRRASLLLGEGGRTRIRDPDGIYWEERPLMAAGGLALLFPGEGAYYPGMLSDLRRHFPEMALQFDLAKAGALDADASDPAVSRRSPRTNRAGPEGSGAEANIGGVTAAERGFVALLGRLGLRAQAVVGHSGGEFAALHAAGAHRPRDPLDVTRAVALGLRAARRIAVLGSSLESTLVAVSGVDRQDLEAALRSVGGCALAMDNCPGQVVLSGDEESIGRVESVLRPRGAVLARLGKGRAYHTPAFAPACDALREYFTSLPLHPPHLDLWSCATAERFPSDAAGVVEAAVLQWRQTVRFRETIREMHRRDVRLFVEAGPRGVLSGFVRNTLADLPHAAIPLDLPARGGLEQLCRALGELAAHGVAFEVAELTRGRRTVELDLRELPVPAPHARPSSLPRGARESAFLDFQRTMREFLDLQSRVMLNFVGPRAPTMRRLPPELRAAPIDLPLLGTVLRHEPGSHLMAEAELDARRHRFLRDHAFFGRWISERDPDLHPLPVMPLAMTLELMAEAAAALSPGKRVSAIKDVRTRRWLTFETPTRRVRTEARLAADGTVRAAVFESDRGEADGIVAEAIVELSSRETELGPPTVPDRATGVGSWGPEGVYARALFHGPAFQGIVAVERCDDRGVRALVREPDPGLLLAAGETVTLLLPAGLIDVGGQLPGVQVVGSPTAEAPEVELVFPNRVDRIEFGPSEREGPFVGISTLERSGGEVHSDVEFLDREGRVALRLLGRVDQRVRVPGGLYAYWPDPSERTLTSPIGAFRHVPGGEHVQVCAADRVKLSFLVHRLWQQSLARLILSRKELADFEALRQPPARAAAWLLGRAAAKDAIRLLLGFRGPMADVTVVVDPGGKPSTECKGPKAPRVSIAHAGGVAVAAAVDPDCFDDVGIDIELVRPLPVEVLEDAFTPAERVRIEEAAEGREDARVLWYTSGWCAKEASAKATGATAPFVPRHFEIVGIEPVSGGLTVAPRAPAQGEPGSRPLLDGRSAVIDGSVVVVCLRPTRPRECDQSRGIPPTAHASGLRLRS